MHTVPTKVLVSNKSYLLSYIHGDIQSTLVTLAGDFCAQSLKPHPATYWHGEQAHSLQITANTGRITSHQHTS